VKICSKFWGPPWKRVEILAVAIFQSLISSARGCDGVCVCMCACGAESWRELNDIFNEISSKCHECTESSTIHKLHESSRCHEPTESCKYHELNDILNEWSKCHECTESSTIHELNDMCVQMVLNPDSWAREIDHFDRDFAFQVLSSSLSLFLSISQSLSLFLSLRLSLHPPSLPRPSSLSLLPLILRLY